LSKKKKRRILKKEKKGKKMRIREKEVRMEIKGGGMPKKIKKKSKMG
jgi:hypothetical protein